MLNIHSSLGPLDAPIKLLYINPNSTLPFTLETVTYLSESDPVPIDFYTAPSTAPPSIDGTLHGVISTAEIIRDLKLETFDGVQELREKYDAIVVSCFSEHPLIPVLKEQFALYQGAGVMEKKVVVLGILEAGIIAALQLGPTFGIATTGRNWEPLFDQAIRTLLIDPNRYTGTRGTGFNAVNLHGDGPEEKLLEAGVELVEKGAKVIVLGCAGMAPMRQKIQDRLKSQTGQDIPVVDGVLAALDQAIQQAQS
ncbi:hypothetical protein TREMEDRAFT_33698 [Tremella mesenterica DSM 1558]|uniref:uncharacterized protein n=1 Tax=Tremella mesenterica (strain ATCC 24925 / CBS 8224 / DSM 1558 / NBRC 9311 / NRRL Y-6157 / RJB 2259-6 / UBC 559-6) TaxID=578456 RepID=UPI0003F499E5|nr:uncharacterized protein TREMEDRAFT_33698 [Tremella mesenterica DSM 1558]EIW67167.1 hypothetical protein TREMEDRAFT_33698 [Tremella mesenterica DSM 1558]